MLCQVCLQDDKQTHFKMLLNGVQINQSHANVVAAPSTLKLTLKTL